MEILKSFCRLCITLAALALAAQASAQVSINLVINNASFLQYEAVYAKVTLKNFSAHPLAFGESKELQGRLKFEIEGPFTGFAKQISDELPPMIGVILMPGEQKTMSFVLSKYYKLQQLGKYKTTAFIEHPQLNAPYESNACFFSIISGNLLLERSFGLPDFSAQTEASAKIIKTRKYRILDFFDGRNKVYALSVEDDKMVYAVKRLGFDMGAALKPTCEVDSLSRMNILLPINPKIFAYYVYSTDGTLEKRDIFIKTSTTPTLVADKNDGTVMVVGGRGARKDLDYEEFKDLPFMDSVVESKKGKDEEEE